MKILAKFCLLLVSYLVTLTGVEGDTTSCMLTESFMERNEFIFPEWGWDETLFT